MLRCDETMLLLRLFLLATVIAFPSASASAQDSPRQFDLPEEIRLDASALAAAMEMQDATAATSAITRLVAHRIEREIGNLTPVATLYLALHADATRTMPLQSAILLARHAVRLAPDFPPMHLHLAHMQLRNGVEGVGPAVGSLSDAISALLRSPRYAFHAGSNVAFYVFMALLLTVLLSAFLFLLRYGAELSHDIGDLFPTAPAGAFSATDLARSRRTRVLFGRGLNRALGFVIVVLALVLPFFAGIGVLGSAIVWLLLVVPYARRAELASVGLLLFAISLLPFMAGLVLLPGTFDSATGPRTWTCLHETCDTDSASRVGDRVNRLPDDPWGRVALALHSFQQAPGDIDALEGAEAQLVQSRLDRTGVVGTFLGNIRVNRALLDCADGTPNRVLLDGAVRSYSEVLDRNPSPPSATVRGLAIAQGLARDRSGMEETLKTLVAITPDEDLDFVAGIRTLTATSSACRLRDSIVAELRLPRRPDWQVFMDGLAPMQVPPRLPFGGWLEGRIPSAAMPYAAGVGLLVFLVLVFTRSRFRVASTCPRCNEVSCRRCNVESSGFDYCPICLFDQVRPAFVDPLDMIAMQQQRDSHRAKSRLLLPVISLAMPGAGQILSGRPLRGGLMLLLLGLAFGLLISPLAPVVDPLVPMGGIDARLPLGPPVLLIVVYLWSTLDLWVNRQQ
jgi:TM2 domain-containing membrane protein YozV